MTINFHADCLELDIDTAKALVAFASKDPTRTRLGVGINGGCVVATDGHALLRFDHCGAPTALEPLEGKQWTRKYVETALKGARVHKVKSIQLPYADMSPEYRMPPLDQIVPMGGITATEPVGFNPAYVALISQVCKACNCEGATLVTLGSPRDPMKYAVRGKQHNATVVIMPIRM